MKTTKIKSTILTVLAIFSISLATYATKKPVNVKKSNIAWVGKKVVGKHNGTLKFKSGYVELENKKLVGGNFIVDMNSILVTDLTGKSKGQLEGHLKADDFFGVSEHSEATFVITNVEGNNVKGNLTIKGHTEKVAFTLVTKENTISGDIKIDRTKFGIKYGSKSFFDGLKDKAIDNEFELSLYIVF